jgi:urease accessory protein UreH/urease accessory protein UreF
MTSVAGRAAAHRIAAAASASNAKTVAAPFVVPQRGPLFCRVQQGVGRLVASAGGDNDTQLTTIAHQAPWRWIPLRSSAVARAGAAVVYGGSYGAGALAGDTTELSIEVQKGTRLAVLSQGAHRIYPQVEKNKADTDTRPTTYTARYDVAADGLLVVAPDPLTPQRDCVWEQNIDIHLHDPSANVCFIDWTAAGRVTQGERWQARSLSSKTTLWSHYSDNKAKRPLLVDSVHWESPTAVDRFGPACQAYASLILAGPQMEIIRQRCTQLTTALTAPYTTVRELDNHSDHDWSATDSLLSTLAGPVYMGVSDIDSEELNNNSNSNITVVRLASTNNDDLYRVLYTALQPLASKLGHAVYHERIRAVHSATVPSALLVNNTQRSNGEKQDPTKIGGTNLPLPSSLTPAALWAAHLLTDAGLPTGGFAHSAGLEVAAQVGWLQHPGEKSPEEAIYRYAAATVHSTLQQVTPSLRRVHETMSSNNGFLGDDIFQDVQSELHALLVGNGPACRASLDQGTSLWRLAQGWLKKSSAVKSELPQSRLLHYAPVFGWLTAHWGLSLEESRHLLAYCVGRDVVSAAVRLNLVGPLASVPLLARLHEAVPPLDKDKMASSSAPVLEALQPLHEILAVRLFRT